MLLQQWCPHLNEFPAPSFIASGEKGGPNELNWIAADRNSHVLAAPLSFVSCRENLEGSGCVCCRFGEVWRGWSSSRYLLTEAGEPSTFPALKVEPLQMQGDAGSTWCWMTEAGTSSSCPSCPFGRHSCPEARMCSSRESSPQLHKPMCHYISWSLCSPQPWPKTVQSRQDLGRSCSDAGQLSSEEKQERQVQRQVWHKGTRWRSNTKPAGTGLCSLLVSTGPLPSGYTMAAPCLQLEMRKGLPQSIQHRQDC